MADGGMENANGPEMLGTLTIPRKLLPYVFFVLWVERVFSARSRRMKEREERDQKVLSDSLEFSKFRKISEERRIAR
jgi:hypothetical protein